jgi:hypothetical protein
MQAKRRFHKETANIVLSQSAVKQRSLQIPCVNAQGFSFVFPAQEYTREQGTFLYHFISPSAS